MRNFYDSRSVFRRFHVALFFCQGPHRRKFLALPMLCRNDSLSVASCVSSPTKPRFSHMQTITTDIPFSTHTPIFLHSYLSLSVIGTVAISIASLHKLTVSERPYRFHNHPKCLNRLLNSILN